MMSLQTTSAILETAYRVNQFRLNDSMARVASGKRLMSPSDDTRDYFRVRKFRDDLAGYSEAQHQISYGQGFIKTATQVGGLMWDEVSKMNDYLKQYYTTDDQLEQDALRARFNALRDSVTQQIGATYYERSRVVADGQGTPALKVMVDGRDVSSTLNIEYGAGETADVSALTIGATDLATESAAMQTQIDKVGKYIARTSAYLESLDTYHSLLQNKIMNYQKSVETMENLDTGAEMMKVSKRNIQVQMSVAMMAQSNMIRSSVLSLLGIGK